MIINSLKKGDVVMMNASLEIHNRKNDVEVGILLGSTLDLDADYLRSFTDIALESAQDRQEGLIEFRLHTFACRNCPDFLKEEDCLSDGRFCAFFPKDTNVGDEKVWKDEKQLEV